MSVWLVMVVVVDFIKFCESSAAGFMAASLVQIRHFALLLLVFYECAACLTDWKQLKFQRISPILTSNKFHQIGTVRSVSYADPNQKKFPYFVNNSLPLPDSNLNISSFPDSSKKKIPSFWEYFSLPHSLPLALSLAYLRHCRHRPLQLSAFFSRLLL